MPGPLAHLTVVDLSRVLAGPWCTQLLADLGAEVIKIEKPGGGDDTRRWGPPFLKDASGRDTTEAAYYLGCNRGKQSVAVDFTSTDGGRIVRDLCRAGRHRRREFQGRRAGPLRPRLRCVVRDQSAAGLLLDHRIRPDRPVRRSRGLRFHHPGHRRLHERHRRARRSAGRRSAEGGHRRRRPDDRHVRDDGDPGGDRASRGRPASASTSIPRCSIRRSR